MTPAEQRRWHRHVLLVLGGQVRVAKKVGVSDDAVFQAVADVLDGRAIRDTVASILAGEAELEREAVA